MKSSCFCELNEILYSAFKIVGHRSNAVRAYKRTSSEQEIKVSDILYGADLAKKPRKEKEGDKAECTVPVKTPNNETEKNEVEFKAAEKMPINICFNFKLN